MESKAKRTKINNDNVQSCNTCWNETIHIFVPCCSKNSCLKCELENFDLNQENVKCLQCGERKNINEIIKFLELYDQTKLEIFTEKDKQKYIIKCANCKKTRLRPNINELNSISIPCLTKGCCEMCFFCGEEYNELHNCLNIKMDDNFKKCPSCYNIIEKMHGCDHLKCGFCEYEFCWICLGNYDSFHNTQPCGLKFQEKQIISREEYLRGFIQNSEKFILQFGSWKYLVNGITAISNFYLKFIFGKTGTIVELMNIFGNRYRNSQFMKKREIDITFIINCLNIFLGFFFRHLIIFSIKYDYDLHSGLLSPEKNQFYIKILHFVTTEKEMEIMLNSPNGLTLSIIQFIKSLRTSTLKSNDIEEWLKINLIQKIANFDNEKKYFPFIINYFSDFTIELNYLKTQNTNIIIKQNIPPLKNLLKE